MNRILYLHGFASGPGSTKAAYFREVLARRGITLEVPNLSENGLEHITVSHELAVVERTARGEPVTLIGSSLGGYLAALYAARHPEVERLLLLAPAFGFGERMLEIAGPERALEWKRAGSICMADDNQETRISYDLIEDAVRYEPYPATTQPVLIFHGTRDKDVYWSVSREFARRTAGVTLELADSGHDLHDVLDRIWGAARVFLGLD